MIDDAGTDRHASGSSAQDALSKTPAGQFLSRDVSVSVAADDASASASAIRSVARFGLPYILPEAAALGKSHVPGPVAFEAGGGGVDGLDAERYCDSGDRFPEQKARACGTVPA